MRAKSIFKGLFFLGLMGAAGVAGFFGYRAWQDKNKIVPTSVKKAEKLVWVTDKPIPETVEPGAYLAALNAVFNDDLEKAADYYLDVLKGDPGNEDIQREAYFFNAILGKFEALRSVTEKLPDDYRAVFFTNYVQMGYAVHDEKWQELRDSIKKQSTLPLDELVLSW